MSVSYVEDEDVLQLLTGDDEFDAEIDEDAEEELLREDVINYDNERQMDAIHGSQDCDDLSDNKINKTIAGVQSMDDEEEDEDRDSGRERFKSERIMSLASVPTRRREIPDSLDSISVNLNENKTDKNNYINNNRRHNQQKFRQNINNNNHSGIDFNRNNNFRSNQGLLPLPPMNNLMPQHIQHQTQQHQRMLLIQPNVYGQQFQPQINNSNNNSAHNIHVNPHFRARASPQFDQFSQVFRPQEPVRMQNMLMQSRPQYPQQNPINSQQMLINQQMRPQFVGNQTLYNDQNGPQMTTQSQQPLIIHPPQPQPHQMQMEHQWRNPNVVQPFQMQQHLGGQQLMPQQMQINRHLNPTQMFNNPQPTQQSFSNPSFNPDFQPNNNVFIPPTGVQHSLNPQNNNFNNQYSMEAQRFPIQSNFNPMQFQNQTPFQPQPNQPIHNNNNNMNPQMHQQFRCEAPPRQRFMKPINQQKRINTQSQGMRINKPLIGANDQQKVDALRAAQIKTKRAKQLLTKKAQNVKEVPLVKSPIVSSIKQKQITESVKKVNAEIEASVGVDEEYKKKMEEQKRLREEILRKKEERRKAMAAQRIKESKPVSQTNRVLIQKVSPTKSQPQQQIATLLNRSPQIQQRFQVKQAPKRIVKPISNEINTSNSSIKVINTNQKRSVLIKGLASSTTELAIKKLCKSVGVIESCKIGINGGQKNAIVTFIRSQDAITFQSKYERTLLDLSIIQVSLIWFVFINFYNNYSIDNYILSFHCCLSSLIN